MAIDHLLALFELGKYEKFLYEVDAMIEFVVNHNIYRHNGEDAFCLLLFKKAAAHFNLEEWDASKTILMQLKKSNLLKISTSFCSTALIVKKVIGNLICGEVLW